MGELEGELVWEASEWCSKFRIEGDRVGESRDVDPVEEPAWHRDEVPPSATMAVEGLAGGLISVLVSARALLLRGRMVACGKDTEGLSLGIGILGTGILGIGISRIGISGMGISGMGTSSGERVKSSRTGKEIEKKKEEIRQRKSRRRRGTDALRRRQRELKEITTSGMNRDQERRYQTT